MSYKTKFKKKIRVSKSGLTRDDNTNKPRYDLIVPEKMSPNMLDRWAALMARGAHNHGQRNWEKANTQEDLQRFKESAFRHFMAWFKGEDDEDHASALFFNVQGVEYIKNRGIIKKWKPQTLI